MSNATSACNPFHVVNKQLSLFEIAQFLDDVGPTSTKSWNFLLGFPFSERPLCKPLKCLQRNILLHFSSEKLFSSWQKKKSTYRKQDTRLLKNFITLRRCNSRGEFYSGMGGEVLHTCNSSKVHVSKTRIVLLQYCILDQMSNIFLEECLHLGVFFLSILPLLIDPRRWLRGLAWPTLLID